MAGAAPGTEAPSSLARSQPAPRSALGGDPRRAPASLCRGGGGEAGRQAGSGGGGAARIFRSASPALPPEGAAAPKTPEPALARGGGGGAARGRQRLRQPASQPAVGGRGAAGRAQGATPDAASLGLQWRAAWWVPRGEGARAGPGRTSESSGTGVRPWRRTRLERGEPPRRSASGQGPRGAPGKAADTTPRPGPANGRGAGAACPACCDDLRVDLQNV